MEQQSPNPGSPSVTTINLLLERISRKSERLPNGCLIWTGAVSRSGYGLVGVENKSRPVAQVVWEIEHQQAVPEGNRIAHNCGNKNCHELSHISLVKKSEHVRRSSPLIAEKSTSAEARFRSKTKRDSAGHLLWIGEKTGNFTVDGRSKRARRFAWEKKYSVCLLPDTRLLRLCDQADCVEPLHHREVSRDHHLKSSPKVQARLGETIERYWKKVGRGAPEQCWRWVGKVPPGQYASFAVQPGETVKAHRFGYETVYGRLIPDGYELANRCGDRACQNPDHWEPVPKHTRISAAGVSRRFTAERRKPFEREAIKGELLASPELSSHELADRLNVSPGLVRQVRSELIQTGILADGPTVGKDGKRYVRTREPRPSAREALRQEFLKDSTQSTHSLAARHAVSPSVVTRLRKEMAASGELGESTFVTGVNGQRYEVGSARQRHGQGAGDGVPPHTISDELEFTNGEETGECIWHTEKHRPCKNRPRRGYQFCRHHLKHRQLSPTEKAQIESANQTINVLFQQVSTTLRLALNQSFSAKEAAELAATTAAAAAADYREALPRFPELTESLSLRNVPREAASELVSGWAQQLAMRLEPGIRIRAGLIPPDTGGLGEKLPDGITFAADRIHISVVVALCNVELWTPKDGWDRSYETQLGKRGFRAQLGFDAGENEAGWEVLKRAPELALKLQYLLWARYLHRSVGWARVSMEQLLQDLGFSPHHSGGFRSAHKKSVLQLLQSLSRLRIEAVLDSGETEPSGRPSGPLWLLQPDLPSVGGVIPASAAVSFRPGPWYTSRAWELQTGYRGRIRSEFLNLTTNHDQLCIRLGAYLATQARVGEHKAGTGRISTATLLARTGLAVYTSSRPRWLAAAVSQALDKLSERGILADWDFIGAEPKTADAFQQSTILYRWPSR